MPQFTEFKNNEYPYPARPKDQWELGGGVGNGFVAGDHRFLGAKNRFGGRYNGGLTGNITLRKSLSHVLSVRVGYYGSMTSIPSQDFKNNPGAFPAAKNYMHELSADMIVSLNTLSYYRGNPKVNFYVLAGYDLVATMVTVNKPGNPSANYRPYYYPTYELITTFGGGNNAAAQKADRKNWALMHAYDFGGGVAFKLSDKFNIGLEQRFVVPMFGNDYLDGVKSGKGDDTWSQSTIRLNMNLGTKSGTRVAPLWWINPNNYVYNEVNKPKHMLIPTPVLPDADGDGITDQFDLEPNTPAGAPVDSHGRAKDTDGDGVPDYKDKEVLTPQSCFPVNADGVGTCPEPACCKELRDSMMAWGAHRNTCNLSSLPSVTFKAGSARLSKDAMNILMGAAGQINANPTCNVKVIGYAADANKRSQQLAWDRVNAVIKYLVEKEGVAESRIIFSYENIGTSNTVDLQPTTESGPNTVPAPHPQYRTTH
ncbi:MAG TPA: OmpA family protein [Chitinophagaceae bacterium]|nr:OmpA family protein [Chitinophagaceae bacterium]